MHVDAAGDFGIHRVATAAIVNARWIVTACVMVGWSAITVWLVHHPADSTSLENGAASSACLAVIGLVVVDRWAVAWFSRSNLVANQAVSKSRATESMPAGVWLDRGVFWLAGWMCFAAVVNASTGDWRASTNEAWWWVAAAGWLTSLRRVLAGSPAYGHALSGCILALACMLLVLTVHQKWVSLPQTLSQYLADPDGTLRSLGLDAPAGSTARMVFENRLRDGGPTATFALANSLAGPLAMAAVMMASISQSIWNRPVNRVHRWVAMGLAVSLLVATYLTGSRGGVAAIMAGFVWVVFRPWSSRAMATLRHRSTAMISGCVAFALMLAFTGFTMVGGGFSERLPESIAFRWQYWRATLAMVADHAIVGVGPGNFQIAYQAYRDIHAHETIAEPHHFWFETLADGGWVAGGIMASVTGLVLAMRVKAIAVDEPTEPTTSQRGWSVAGLVVLVGSFVGFGAVWCNGLLTGLVPDVDAMLWAIPAAAMAGAWWSRVDVRFVDVGRASGIALAAGVAHLCLSGGLTVPGVAAVWISLLAMATSVDLDVSSDRDHIASASGDRPLRVSSVRTWLVPVMGSIVLVLFTVQSWLPQRQAAMEMLKAQSQLRAKRTNAAIASLDRAMRADEHAIEPAVWNATLINDASLQTPGGDKLPTKLQEAIEEVESRGGHDPKWSAYLGELFLQRYQVRGRMLDLVESWNQFARAVSASPTQQAYLAQAAEIAREVERIDPTETTLDSRTTIDWPRRLVWSAVDDMLPLPKSGRPTSSELARWAAFVAESGGVLTRRLSLQPILPAQAIGPAAAREPRRMPADELMRGIFDGTGSLDLPPSR